MTYEQLTYEQRQQLRAERIEDQKILDELMRRIHDSKTLSEYEATRWNFISHWNQYHPTQKLSFAEATGMFVDGEVNIGGFWFKVA